MPAPTIDEVTRLTLIRDYLRRRVQETRASTIEANTHGYALALELNFVETVLAGVSHARSVARD
jgi:hypothetical protein